MSRIREGVARTPKSIMGVTRPSKALKESTILLIYFYLKST